jgi:hypothetical protein
MRSAEALGVIRQLDKIVENHSSHHLETLDARMHFWVCFDSSWREKEQPSASSSLYTHPFDAAFTSAYSRTWVSANFVGVELCLTLSAFLGLPGLSN